MISLKYVTFNIRSLHLRKSKINIFLSRWEDVGGKIKKNIASARDWTHNNMVKQKVDEFSTKAVPLSNLSILQRMTGYYYNVNFTASFETWLLKKNFFAINSHLMSGSSAYVSGMLKVRSGLLDYWPCECSTFLSLFFVCKKRW